MKKPSLNKKTKVALKEIKLDSLDEVTGGYCGYGYSSYREYYRPRYYASSSGCGGCC